MDVADLERGAAFWCALLDLTEVERDADYAWLSDVGPGVKLILQQSSTPKLGKNRVHLELIGEGEDTVARALALGAALVRRVEEPTYTLAVLADPDGNEFCVTLRPSGAISS